MGDFDQRCFSISLCSPRRPGLPCSWYVSWPGLTFIFVNDGFKAFLVSMGQNYGLLL